MHEADDKVELLVGTYARNGGAGIRSLVSTAGSLMAGPTMCDVTDASFGLWRQDRSMLYVVGEDTEGRVHALQPRGGVLHRLWDARTSGAAPCHLALDDDGSQLLAANYESGSITTIAIHPDGPEQSTLLRLTGSGPDEERQAGPHAHWVGRATGSDHYYCVDLGSDTIWRFDRGATAPTPAFRAPPGSGPRHLAFHPREPLAFLVSELASTVTCLAVDADGSLHTLASQSTSPFGVTKNLGGHILLNQAANRLYVTNRGHDSIAVFAVDGAELRMIEHVRSGGASPRFMLLLEAERRLLVANEEGGTVRQFHVADDGTLVAHATIIVPGAAFLIEAR